MNVRIFFLDGGGGFMVASCFSRESSAKENWKAKWELGLYRVRSRSELTIMRIDRIYHITI